MGVGGRGRRRHIEKGGAKKTVLSLLVVEFECFGVWRLEFCDLEGEEREQRLANNIRGVLRGFSYCRMSI